LLVYGDTFLAKRLFALQAVHRFDDEIKADHARQAFVVVKVGGNYVFDFQMVAYAVVEISLVGSIFFSNITLLFLL